MGQLFAHGVTVTACANTMCSLGVSNDGLLPGVTVVTSGVGELARRQLAGWAYLRP